MRGPARPPVRGTVCAGRTLSRTFGRRRRNIRGAGAGDSRGSTPGRPGAARPARSGRIARSPTGTFASRRARLVHGFRPVQQGPEEPVGETVVIRGDFGLREHDPPRAGSRELRVDLTLRRPGQSDADTRPPDPGPRGAGVQPAETGGQAPAARGQPHGSTVDVHGGRKPVGYDQNLIQPARFDRTVRDRPEAWSFSGRVPSSTRGRRGRPRRTTLTRGDYFPRRSCARSQGGRIRPDPHGGLRRTSNRCQMESKC